MRNFNQSARRSILAICFTLTSSTLIAGEQWPANQAPVENPVPQYVSPRNLPTGERPNIDAPVPNFFERSPQDVLVPNPLQSPPADPKKIPPKTDEIGQPKLPQIDPLSTRSQQDERHQQNVQSQQTTGRALNETQALAPGSSGHQSAKHFTVDYSIFRDRSPYPVDPRKPYRPCLTGKCRSIGLGHGGRPYQEREPGGCQCDSRHPWKHPNFSVHWPRPFSAVLDEHHPEQAAARYTACPKKRCVDIFDGLSSFKLSGYQRTDNGYCGPGSDPYGCPGESQLTR